MKKTTQRILLAAAMTAMGGGLMAGHYQVFKTQIRPLNASFDESGKASGGYAVVALDLREVEDDFQSGVATIDVMVHVEGLEDLTSISGAAHVAHVHGRSVAGMDPTTGEGAIARSSVIPDVFSDDADGDGFLNLLEGLPDYGPVLLNLSLAQVPHAEEGVSPLMAGLNFLGENDLTPADAFPTGETFHVEMTYSFDVSDPDARRQLKNLLPLTSREIVVHGLTVPTSISNSVDTQMMEAGLPEALYGVEVNDTESFRITAPVAAGSLEPAVNLGPNGRKGWRSAGSYGWINASLFPWVYHPDFGLQYVQDYGENGLWIYDRQLGWLYTPESIGD